MIDILAIDPGSEHCGMALGCVDDTRTEVVKVWEEDPDGCHDWVRGWCLDADQGSMLVVEEFRLYPNKMQQQAWSNMGTVEVIGVLRYLWSRIGAPRGIDWLEQGANIKKPIQRILRAKDIVSRAKVERAGGHAMDAELHFYRAVWSKYDGLPGL